MQIQTQQGEKNVASQALAGTALGLAIPGTISFLNQLVGGGLNFLNGNCNPAAVNVTNNTADTRTIGTIYSEYMKEKSERYADGIGISTFKEAQAMSDKTNDRLLALEKFVYEIDKKIAVERQQTVDNFAYLNNEICNTKKELMCYVNATFVPGKLVMPLDAICPPAQAATTTT